MVDKKSFDLCLYIIIENNGLLDDISISVKKSKYQKTTDCFYSGTIHMLRHQKDWVGGSRKYSVLYLFVCRLSGIYELFITKLVHFMVR